MRAEIVTIGTEILLGQIVDTNATKIAQRLKEIGVDLYYKTTVGDNEARITNVLNHALNRADIIITSGGLGPTVDDMTRRAVANATGRPLVHSPELEAEIAARFRGFGRPMGDNNKRQAYIPEGAQPLTNPVGTAPCFLAEDRQGRGAIISLPGVPRELEYMLTNTVIPLIVARMGGRPQVIKTRILRTCAVGESNIDNAIGDLMVNENPTVGLAAHAGQTDVRITAKAETEIDADALIAPMEAKLRERLGIAIYGTGEETLPAVVGQLLVDRGMSLGIIDTVTGGELHQWVVDAHFSQLIATSLYPESLESAQQATGLTADEPPETLVEKFARKVAPGGGIGLALIGPFADNSVLIGVAGPADFVQVWPTHHYQANAYRRRWLIIQGLDWMRRVLLGELSSPVDWAVEN